MFGLIGALSVVPLQISFLGVYQAAEKTKTLSSIFQPLEWWLKKITIHSAIISTALICGFFAVERLGFPGAPLLETGFTGGLDRKQFSIFITPAVSGVLSGIIVSPLALYRSKDMKVDFYKIALWKRFLAGVFHGGILEEILFRWAGLSLLAWVFLYFFGHSEGLTNEEVFWLSNLGLAIVFGLAHLAGTAAAGPLTTFITISVVALNTCLGLLFGYFFWEYGIEAAILAHMCFHVGFQPASTLLRKHFAQKLSDEI